MKTSGSDRPRQWERTMRTGTDAARYGRALLAEGLYLRALALSRRLLDHSSTGEERADDRVAAFVVTHLNLADLHTEGEHTVLAALPRGRAPRADGAAARSRRRSPPAAGCPAP